MSKTAIIIGSTGLTGSHLLDMLLASNVYDKVISFVRQNINLSHPKLTQYIIDFEHPESYQELVAGDDLFCCLGTTIKKAGSKEAFEMVDLTYTIEFAKIAAYKGVKQVSVISSIGANPKTGNFYLRTKGRLEEELRQLPFQSISIFRPSLLLGNRNEFRTGEKISTFLMKILSPFLLSKLRKYKAIKASQVANAMLLIAQRGTVGYHVYESNEIADISALS